MTNRIIHRLLIVLALWSLPLFSAQAQEMQNEEDVIILFDASASMLAASDGEPKIDAAKRVVTEFLKSSSPQRNVGLVAFGHRRAGNCQDIETLVPLGRNRKEVAQAVKDIKPRGITPLSTAIEKIATENRGRTRPLTVFLVSDGGDQCFRDPCELAKEMEAANASFTAHVVGLGEGPEHQIPQLQCIANATGGRFVTANQVIELTQIDIPETDNTGLTRLTLRATELEGGAEITKGLIWRVVSRKDQSVVYQTNGLGTVTIEVEPGEYDVYVTRPEDQTRGSLTNITVGGEKMTYTIALETKITAALRTDPASPVPAGSDIKIYWQGPGRDADMITISDPVNRGRQQVALVSTGNPVSLILPLYPGKYEVQYVASPGYNVVERLPLDVTDVQAALSGPKAVAPGQEFEVKWRGPAYKYDMITISPVGGDPASFKSVGFTTDGNPVQLEAPTEPGTYELQYWLRGRRKLAEQPIIVGRRQQDDVQPTLNRRLEVQPQRQRIEPQQQLIRPKQD